MIVRAGSALGRSKEQLQQALNKLRVNNKHTPGKLASSFQPSEKFLILIFFSQRCTKCNDSERVVGVEVAITLTRRNYTAGSRNATMSSTQVGFSCFHALVVVVVSFCRTKVALRITNTYLSHFSKNHLPSNGHPGSLLWDSQIDRADSGPLGDPRIVSTKEERDARLVTVALRLCMCC